jgi:SAM-dependent methyltransferase
LYNLKNIFRLKELDRLDIDDPATTVIRRKIVRRKRFLYEVYRHFYKQMFSLIQKLPKGPIIELGSGPGFIKEIIPSAMTSEVFLIPDLDLVCSGQNLPFKDQSISCLLMLDVFHHIPKPIQFLKEAERCLLRGGRVLMVEPYNTLFGRFFYQKFHQECFDPHAGWEHQERGPLSGANGALPWIIFVRDQHIFKKNFSSLQVKSIKPHTPFAYLLSGGLSFNSFLPGICFGPVRIIENLLSPLNNHIGLFATISLEKT